MATFPTLRPALPSDLESLVVLTTAATKSDPVSDYAWPKRRQDPEAEASFRRYLIEDSFSDIAAGKGAMVVAEATDPQAEDGKRLVGSIGYRIFDPTSLHKRDVERRKASCVHPPGSSLDRIANAARLQAYCTRCEKGEETFFSSYGQGQLNFQILVVHPDYQRRGIGTKLCRWAMEEAERAGVVVTTIASPMGMMLYRKLRFKILGWVEAQVDGEDEILEMPAMVWGES